MAKADFNVGAKLDGYQQPDTPQAWKQCQTAMFDVLRGYVEDSPYFEHINSFFMYDASSRMKILAKLGELEQAIHSAVVLRKSNDDEKLGSNVVSFSRRASQG